jgi:hypothetical protein
MKKTLLLLVSGLLIACMAGAAMAAGSNIYDAAGTTKLSNIEVSAGGAGTHISYGVNTFSPDYLDHTFYYISAGTGNQIKAEVTPLTSGGSESDITVEYVNHISFVADKDPYVDINNLVVYAADGTEGNKYSIAIPIYVDDKEAGKLVFQAAASAKVTTVPEFPTVALPVAAILGLVFIFGRKKEGL